MFTCCLDIGPGRPAVGPSRVGPRVVLARVPPLAVAVPGASLAVCGPLRRPGWAIAPRDRQARPGGVPDASGEGGSGDTGVGLTVEVRPPWATYLPDCSPAECPLTFFGKGDKAGEKGERLGKW